MSPQIGLYTQLFEVLCAENTEYCGTFRRDANNMADMHLHLVLQRFLGTQAAAQDPLWRMAQVAVPPKPALDTLSTFEKIRKYVDVTFGAPDRTRMLGRLVENQGLDNWMTYELMDAAVLNTHTYTHTHKHKHTHTHNCLSQLCM